MTRLEEVDIEAQANDDYGVERVELVYAVRGQAEKIVPLAVPARRSTSVTVRHTLYLEDLDVRPGDFVSYYVRARDISRGPRSNEGRSDIFFLEVRPFEQEFSLAQSQSMAGSGYTEGTTAFSSMAKTGAPRRGSSARCRDGGSGATEGDAACRCCGICWRWRRQGCI